MGNHQEKGFLTNAPLGVWVQGEANGSKENEAKRQGGGILFLYSSHSARYVPFSGTEKGSGGAWVRCSALGAAVSPRHHSLRVCSEGQCADADA